MGSVDLLVVDVTVPRRWLLSSNGSHGTWSMRSRVRRDLRHMGHAAWWAAGGRQRYEQKCGPLLDRAALLIEIRPDVRARRDVMNLAESWKAIIDGMVTGPPGWPQSVAYPGVLPDDSSAYLRGPLPVEDATELCPRGEFRFRLRFQPWPTE